MSKPIAEQVVVITGASSGIGREAALLFGKAGASVVLTARNEDALHAVAGMIEQAGGRALVVPADVTDWEQVQQVAKSAVDTFGRIDTWINNAGISVYATAENTTVEEAHQVMHTNFMGMVHGVSAALPYMKRQGRGTIINVGSVESQRSLPLQSVYAASKHAVKGYTEALRLEQEAANSGIHVTLIMPAGINTPLFNHARSKLGVKPMPMPPVYTPELAASAIVNAAQSPQRDIYVGGAGFLFWLLQRLSPRLLDKMMITNKAMFRLQMTNEPDDGQDNLFQPVNGTGRVHGDFQKLTKPSLYTPLLELTPRWLRNAIFLTLPLSIVASVLYKNRQAIKHGA